MKNNYTLLKALLVAGIVGTMAHVSPLAHAALTAQQITALAGPTSAKNLSQAAVDMVNAATPAAREQLAKDIAAYVAVNKPGLAGFVVASIVQLIPNSVAAIVTAAVQANQAVAASVVTATVQALPSSAVVVAAAATAAAPGSTINFTALATAAVTAAQAGGGTPAAKIPSNPATTSQAATP